MQNIINFIKYNNAFTFMVGLLFIATASTFAASPELRKEAIEAVISQKQTVLSLDNTKLLAQDFGKFDSKLQIKEIKEDNENFYVKYGFRTFVIRDYIWQEDDTEKTLSVSKSFLANRDLGLYTAQELGEVVDYNLSYLKEAREIEKNKGETNKVVAIEYGGLIGKFLDSKEKEFSGYQPIVEEKKIPVPVPVPSPENPFVNATTNQTPSATTPQSVVDVVVIPDKEMVRQMVQEAIREILENKTNAINSSSSNSSEAVLSSSSSISTASSSSSAADTSSSLSSSSIESFEATSSSTSEVSSLSSSSASSEITSSSSDSSSAESSSSSSSEASMSSLSSGSASSETASSSSAATDSSSSGLPAEATDAEVSG